jgi:hypothetical protein
MTYTKEEQQTLEALKEREQDAFKTLASMAYLEFREETLDPEPGTSVDPLILRFARIGAVLILREVATRGNLIKQRAEHRAKEKEAENAEA